MMDSEFILILVNSENFLDAIEHRKQVTNLNHPLYHDQNKVAMSLYV